MKLLLPWILVVFGFLGPCFAKEAISGGHCLNTIHEACSSNNPAKLLEEKNKDVTKCISTFGGFPQLADRAQSLMQKHLQASVQYLLLGAHFSEWDVDRKGFHNFFVKLSDDAWQDALNLANHVTKRGGYLNNFTIPMPQGESYQLGELAAMSKALDIEKGLAARSLNLIHAATHGDVKIDQHTDGEFAHFLANQISERNSVRVKSLANHVNTLSHVVTYALAKNNDPSFVLHLYDEQILP